MGIATTLPVHVAAGVIRRRDGAILLSLRPRHAHQGGLWEFPGGKLEERETTSMALARELGEELGIRLGETVPLIRVNHDYPDKRVLLDVLEVRTWEGEPHGREGQEVRWVMPTALDAYRFPAANLPVITAARLPSFAIRADFSRACDVAGLAAALARSVEAGTRLLCLTLPAGTLAPSLARLLAICREHRARCTAALQGASGEHSVGDGLHLAPWSLRAAKRRPIPVGRLLSATCRNLDDVRRAASLSVDFIYLDVVQGKDGRADHLRAMVAAATMPAFASGPTQAADTESMRRLGCQGVALLVTDAADLVMASNRVEPAASTQPAPPGAQMPQH
ncbi:MAG: Nudix family hydrolase [Gammaproteobacteria bacterium]